MAESEQKRPFPEDNDSEIIDEEGCRRTRHIGFDGSTKQLVSQRVLMCLNVGVLVVNIVFFAFGIYSSINRDSRHSELEIPFSPAREVASHEIRIVNTHVKHNPYAGEPRPEFDEAWSALLKGTSISVSHDKLPKPNKTSSVMTSDGSAYVGYIEAYHQLHCVKRMIQFRYPEDYPGLVKQGKLTDAHFDHCIEALRTGIMCQADLSFTPYNYDSNGRVVADADVPRVCIDWSGVKKWAEDHALPQEELEILLKAS